MAAYLTVQSTGFWRPGWAVVPHSEGRTAVLPKGYFVARRRRPAPPATATPPERQGRAYVLWRHQYDDFEILGAFTSPERFQKYVERRFARMVANSRWRSGESQWTLSTPQWEFVASALNIDD